MSEMENKNTHVLQDEENIGSVQIADDVVTMIAALAAKEVEGVAAMGGSMPGEIISKVSKKNVTKGVKVDILQKNVKVNLYVTVEYGYNIPAISQQIQGKVKSAIENMTGLQVTDVNIRIAGVIMPKSK
ncbi:MAG: Asp23/Gls24 family envelope stress response protein [Lachnospiraceae bacterium]|nr:Asp23/Gls24 family envelope stress response protein [Lachnospiraceae bacterium]